MVTSRVEPVTFQVPCAAVGAGPPLGGVVSARYFPPLSKETKYVASPISAPSSCSCTLRAESTAARTRCVMGSGMLLHGSHGADPEEHLPDASRRGDPPVRAGGVPVGARRRDAGRGGG